MTGNFGPGAVRSAGSVPMPLIPHEFMSYDEPVVSQHSVEPLLSPDLKILTRLTIFSRKASVFGYMNLVSIF